MVQQHLVLLGPGLLQVGVGHLGHIADHVGEGAAEGVDAHLAHVGGDARQLRQAGVDAGELVPGHVVGHGHGDVAARGVELTHQGFALVHRDRDDRGDRVERRVDVAADLVARDQQAEGRAVGRQLHAVAVEDAAAGRRHQAVVELVGGRQLGVAGVVQQLQLHQARGQAEHAEGREAAEQQRPAVEHALPLVDLVEEDMRFAAHRKRGSASSNRPIRRSAKG